MAVFLLRTSCAGVMCFATAIEFTTSSSGPVALFSGASGESAEHTTMAIYIVMSPTGYENYTSTDTTDGTHTSLEHNLVLCTKCPQFCTVATGTRLTIRMVFHLVDSWLDLRVAPATRTVW